MALSTEQLRTGSSNVCRSRNNQILHADQGSVLLLLLNNTKFTLNLEIRIDPITQGWGAPLDTVSEDTEDTAHPSISSVYKIHFQLTCVNGICI